MFMLLWENDRRYGDGLANSHFLRYLFSYLYKRISILLSDWKISTLSSKQIYFYQQIYLRLEWTPFHHWLLCIFFHFLVNSFRIISLFLNISAKWGKFRGKRRFTSYLKYRGGCFMFKKQDPPFVLWKFSREFQSSADKIF